MSIHYEIPLSKRQGEFLNLLMNGPNKYFWSERATEHYRKGKDRSLSIENFQFFLSKHPVDPNMICSWDGPSYPLPKPLETETVHRIARGLYGVIGVYDIGYCGNKHPIYGYFVPDPLHETVNIALSTGTFSVEINEENLPILRTLYERDRELRQQFRMSWNPRFHPTEVARLTDRSKEEARQGLERLIGILAVAKVPYPYYIDATEKARSEAEAHRRKIEASGASYRVEESFHSITVMRKFESEDQDPDFKELIGDESSENFSFIREAKKFRFKWFVPSARRSQIEKILEESRPAILT